MRHAAEITDVGRDFLSSIEAGPAEPASKPAAPKPTDNARLDLSRNVIQIATYQGWATAAIRRLRAAHSELRARRRFRCTIRDGAAA